MTQQQELNYSQPEATQDHRLGIVVRVRMLVRRFSRKMPASRPTFSEPFWDRDAAFMLALAAFRADEIDLAERELTRDCGDRGVNDARCLNLLGAIHERRGHWIRARDCYSRSARLDKQFLPPRANLRRYYELFNFGHTTVRPCLGDERIVQS